MNLKKTRWKISTLSISTPLTQKWENETIYVWFFYTVNYTNGQHKLQTAKICHPIIQYWGNWSNRIKRFV